MALRLFNTLSHSVEPFVPQRENEVRIYVCGLTPSAESHLGHARSFLFFDVLRRYLVHAGYRVTYVQNVTDIDDRSIARARETGESWKAIVEGHYASYKRSMQRLHQIEPDHEPRATDFIPQMVKMIRGLIDEGHAYVVGDGVYYRVKSFARYGALSGRVLEELMVGARIAPGEEKQDLLDFALWKFAKPGEPSWPSPWGDGRPGWHIECSAMSHELLGEPFDIHGGGYDLIFPHHENEIAQTEALFAKRDVRMAKVWMHGGLLNFDGKKMSKSLGNFEPLSSLLDRHDAQAIRLLFLQGGYRKPMNFTEATIDGTTSALRRLYESYDALRAAPAAKPTDAAASRVDGWRETWNAALEDDMNTSAAVSVFFELANETSSLLEAGAGGLAAAFLHEAMGVLGISPNERTLPAAKKPIVVDPSAVHELPADFADRVATLRAAVSDAVPLNGGSPMQIVEQLIAARVAAKAARDFALADRLRGVLADAGVVVTDTKEGPTWSIAG